MGHRFWYWWTGFTPIGVTQTLHSICIFFPKHLDCAEMLPRKPRYDAEPNYRSVKMIIVWSVFLPSISEQLRMLQVHRSSKPNFTKQPFFWTMQHPQTTLAPNHQAGAPVVAHTIPHVRLCCRNFPNIIRQSKVIFFRRPPKDWTTRSKKNEVGQQDSVF